MDKQSASATRSTSNLSEPERSISNPDVETCSEETAIEDQPALEKVVSEKPSIHHPSQFPDGGLRAWLVVAGGYACLFCSFGWINAIGIFQAYYQTDLLKDYPPSTISWIISLETFFMFFGGPVVGKLYDNYGPRYILLTGTFLHVFGLMMASISTQYYQLLLSQGVCSPIGASMIFYPAMSTVLSWFFKRRAFAMGIMASGSSLGGIIWPIMVQKLIPLIGFGWTMRVSAFVILALMIFANLTVKSRLPPHPKPFAMMDFVRPMYSVPFLLLTLGAFCIFFGLFQPFGYVELSALSLGMDPNLAAYVIPILNAASIPGRILPGYVGDKVGRFNVQIAMCALCGILVLALWLPARANAPIIVFAAFYGFASGAFVSIIPAMIAQLVDIRLIGVSTGSMFAIVSIAALIGNPVAGELLTRGNGSFTYLCIVCGVLILFGTGLSVASKASAGKLLHKF